MSLEKTKGDGQASRLKSSVSSHDEDQDRRQKTTIDKPSSLQKSLAETDTKSQKVTILYEDLSKETNLSKKFKHAADTDDDRDGVAMVTSSTGEEDERILSERATPAK